MSDTMLGTLYTLLVLICTKILRDAKFILVKQKTRLEATHLNIGCKKKDPQSLISLLLLVFLPLRIITVKVMKWQALGNVAFLLTLFIYPQ